MGQANRRGTYEDRKTQSEERARAELAAREAKYRAREDARFDRRHPRGPSMLVFAALMAGIIQH